MATKTYYVIEPVRHNGADFAPGTKIDLEPEEAAPLLKVAVVATRKPSEPVDEKPEAPVDNQPAE